MNLGEFASPLGADVLAAGGAGLQQIQTAFELRVSGAGGVRRSLARSRMLRAIRGSPVNASASWAAAALCRFCPAPFARHHCRNPVQEYFSSVGAAYWLSQGYVAPAGLGSLFNSSAANMTHLRCWPGYQRCFADCTAGSGFNLSPWPCGSLMAGRAAWAGVLYNRAARVDDMAMSTIASCLPDDVWIHPCRHSRVGRRHYQKRTGGRG